MGVAIAVSGLALICYLTLIFVTIRHNSRIRTNRAFVLYLAAMTFWQLTALMVSTSQDAESALLWYRLMTVGLVGQFIFHCFFILMFLGVKESRGVFRAGWLIFIALLASSATDLVIKSVPQHQTTGLPVPEFGPLVPAVAICAYVFFGFGVSRLIQASRRARVEVQRTRIKYLLLGAAVIAGGSASNMVPGLQGYPVDVTANVVNAFLIAYAILRYQLLDITLVVRKGLLYSIPTAVIGAAYFLAVYTVARLFHLATDYQVLLLSLMVTAITVVGGERLRSRLQSWVDRLFFRETYNSRLMLQRLSGAAVSILDLDRITGMILREVVTTMHIKRAAFLLKQDRSGEFRLTAQSGLNATSIDNLRADHPVIEWLSDHQDVLTRRDVDVLPEFKALWGQEREDLGKIGAEMFIPLKAGGELAGVFAVGPKLSEDPYSQDDELTLATLANQMAMAIENARLYKAAQQELAERTRAEEQIKASLSEKEVLLKEIHHRVKNNLQVISSLLYLQSTAIQDRGALQMFRDSQSRIRSIALVHERLYQSKDLSRIDFAEYIRGLASYVFRSYGANSRGIDLTIRADDVFLGIDVAVPWALVINELLSNSLKHAFPHGEGGEISIDLQANGDSRLVLTVSDNGVGFPEDVDYRDTKSLGLQLVNTLVQQLEGTLELDTHGGTRFRIAVPQP